MNITTIGARNAVLGEGPIWCAEKKCLYYVDIDGKKLHQVSWDNKELTSTELPQKTGCVSLTNDGKLLYAMEDGIYNHNFVLLHKKQKISGIRFNDGKVGPDGCFYAGTIKKDGGGKLYRLKNGVLETVLDDVRISNGIDWSIDEKTMYYCDTATHKIVAFDAETLKLKETVIEIPEAMGNPDGMCIDTDDCLWIALWGGGAVIRVDARNGEILKKIELPASKISCPCFAGENLDELVVTSASDDVDLNKEPLAGCTFLVKTGAKGRLPYRFEEEI